MHPSHSARTHEEHDEHRAKERHDALLIGMTAMDLTSQEERRKKMGKQLERFGSVCTYCTATGLVVMGIITGAVLLWMAVIYL